MLVIKEIMENGYQRIQEELGIKVKVEDAYVLLDYCQINSPKMDPIVQECRGLILHEGTLDIVCRSFDRFFNYGEGEAQNLNFSGCSVVEKVDGSLIRVWWSERWQEWMVSTRGTIFANSNVHGFEFTFKELFIKTFLDKLPGVYNNDFQLYCNFTMSKGHTYIFELATPYNRVVTRYPDHRISLLNVRSNKSGEYVDCYLPEFPRPKQYSLNSFEDCMEAVEKLGDLQEGFVVLDRNGVPVCKIKSAAYVAVHHIRGEGLNPKRISQLVWSGEVSEYLAYFPEDKHVIDPYEEKRLKVIEEVKELWEKNQGVEGQKDFALAVKDTPYAGVMFRMRGHEASLEEALNTTSDKIKQSWIE